VQPIGNLAIVMARYFISYSRSDQAFALRFAQDLKTAGVDVWVDQLDIPIGQNWDRSVEAAVHECEGFVIILSPRSAASEHVADEVACALEDHKHIIPILIEKCTIPMRLARLQFIDATSDYDNALARFQLIIGAAPGSAAAIASGPSAPSGAVAVQAKPAAHWDPDLLARAEQRLTEHVGPIARLLVSKAAGTAGNEAELYASLALAIPDAAERANFLRQFAGAANGPGGSVLEAVPGESPRTIPQELRDKAGEVLIAHLGPMARLVVMNESREARTPEDLFQRLLARIPSESEKAELLKKLRSLHTG
jgi:TIR domain-containing protein